MKIASYDSLTAWRSETGEVSIENSTRRVSVSVATGDRLLLEWGGMAAAVGATPFDLTHEARGGGATTTLYDFTLLDENGDYLEVLEGLRSFMRAVAMVVDITVVEPGR